MTFPVYDQAVLRQAMEFAWDAHEGQVDKSGLPYIFHPIGVARRAMMRGAPQHIVVAALLHDVVEDCDVELWEVEAGFGPEVAGVVDAKTRRSSETYAQFVDRTCADPDSALLGVCDTEDNLDPQRMAMISNRERAFLHERYGKSLPKLQAAAGWVG